MAINSSPLSDQAIVSPSPLEIIAEELGSIAGRIERELKLSFSTALAEIRQEMAVLRASRAENELRAANAERALADAVSARLAEVRDGERGERGAMLNVGRGPPAAGGHDGDLYFDGETGDVYQFRS